MTIFQFSSTSGLFPVRPCLSPAVPSVLVGPRISLSTEAGSCSSASFMCTPVTASVVVPLRH